MRCEECWGGPARFSVTRTTPGRPPTGQIRKGKAPGCRSRVPGKPGDLQEMTSCSTGGLNLQEMTSCSHTATRQKSSGAHIGLPRTRVGAGTYPVEQPEQPGLRGPSALGEHRGPSLDDGVLVGLLEENAVEGAAFGSGRGALGRGCRARQSEGSAHRRARIDRSRPWSAQRCAFWGGGQARRRWLAEAGLGATASE